jgi:membrane protein YdbS with pleckstrin-like domain
MNGAHRGEVGNPVTATLKSARWLITLIGLVLVAPALLALDLYLLVTGTFPVRLGAAAVFMAAVAAAWIRPGDLRWRQRRGSGE